MALATQKLHFLPSVTAPSFHRRSVVASFAPATRNSSTFTAASITLYDVLGVSSAASAREIKTAYRRLARAHHPDATASHSKDSSAEQFMAIHAAYSTLLDPEKRADYDRKLLLVSSGRGRGRTSFGLSRRSWETDQCW